MSEMAMRVARAIFPFLANVDDQTLQADPLMVRARAAIAAMREPTDAMDRAGLSAHRDEPLWDDGCSPDVIFQAMIDEALR